MKKCIFYSLGVEHCTSKIVLWNAQCFYQLEGHTYQGTKYLSVTRDDFSLTVIDDIGDVQTADASSTDIKLTQCSVVGI